MSNSSRTPVPSAVISAWISVFFSTLSMRDFSTLRILPRSGSTAWVARSRPCLAEPPAESPSTMKISARAGSRTEQSASFPGSVEFSSADLRRFRSPAFPAASPPLARVLLEELRKSLVHGRLDKPLDRRVAELGLGLPLELRIGDLHGDDR